MFITILERFGIQPKNSISQLFLTWDTWNDFLYRTLFGVFYIDEDSNKHVLGEVRIGFNGQQEKEIKLKINDEYEELSSEYFSLGSESYYEALNKLGPTIRNKILLTLRDIAKSNDIYTSAINEKVTEISLLRGITHTEVTGQLRRMANGGAKLIAYQFNFKSPPLNNIPESQINLFFNIVPHSNPPTNINVLIGKNGVGKTTIINNMARAIAETNLDFKYGEFHTNDFLNNEPIFPNLLFVSFSAFDESGLENLDIIDNVDFRYNYIGLNKKNLLFKNITSRKTHEELGYEFRDSLIKCKNILKKDKWQLAIKTLESDSLFDDKNILSLIEIDSSLSIENQKVEFENRAFKVFNSLSSGHKIVLLTITRLVETLEEKSLVLIDEPETHLHPPLLSAFIRSLSDLFINRNSVAIIATHSPVILQEVPSSCVWKLRRNGFISKAERLATESFGENVGILTSEVFGLEVTNSGFYELLKKAVSVCNTYEEGLAYFNGDLGMEARSILNTLIFNKKNIQQ